MWICLYVLGILALASADCQTNACLGNLTCDEQIKNLPQLSCDRLEAYGCVCHGCTCPKPVPTTTSSTYKFLWSEHLKAACSGVVAGEQDKHLSVKQCQEKCAKIATCDGFNYRRGLVTECDYLENLVRGTLQADKDQDCYIYDRPGVGLLTTVSAAYKEMWKNCRCPDSPGVCVDALNFLSDDPAEANCTQKQAALDCALMPHYGSPHGSLCNGRYTPYGRAHPDATCQELALSYSDSVCPLKFNPNALVPTTQNPDIENLPALHEVLSKCTVCQVSKLYCDAGLGYLADMHDKSLALDHCAQIQHAFHCSFVPTLGYPLGFLGTTAG